MQDLDQVHGRLQTNQQKRKSWRADFKQALENNARYQELSTELEKLRLERRAIEESVLNQEMNRSELEGLNLEIKADSEMISDIALNLLLDKQTIEIIDQNAIRWTPLFRVIFKKN